MSLHRTAAKPSLAFTLDVTGNAAPQVDTRPTLYVVTDDTDPASPALTRCVPVLRADVARRPFATFAPSLGDRPDGGDIATTVARLRAHGTDVLDRLRARAGR